MGFVRGLLGLIGRCWCTQLQSNTALGLFSCVFRTRVPVENIRVRDMAACTRRKIMPDLFPKGVTIR